MKKAVVVLMAALTLGWIGVCAAAPLKSEKEPVWETEKMVRLHVVAQSDLACDQDEKLLVRDAVLQILEAPLCNVKSREEAAAVIETMLPQIEEAARGALAKETERDAPQVTTELSTERFPSIAYRGRIVPAGEYMALRITIGRGGGRNWWCVLFPPLCYADVHGVTDEEESARPEVRWLLKDWIERLDVAAT